jgi:luciferase-type oxidoreductase
MAQQIHPGIARAPQPTGIDTVTEPNTEAQALHSHAAYRRVFTPGKLSFGFIMPLEAYPDSPFPTLHDHTRLARMADEAGFAALWMRDVPFYDPQFGDTGQMLDPMVYLGYLAAHTSRIALGTAGIVLPLRDPIIVAKQAASVDQLTGGRLLLGLSTGDRPVEYPAFGAEFENRAERFQEAVSLIRTVTEDAFPIADTRHYGRLDGKLDLVPKPRAKRLPLVVVGRARQDLAWITRNTDGWIGHMSDFGRMDELLDRWREGAQGLGFKPYGYGSFFELDAHPAAPLRYIGNRFSMGRKALIDLWTLQQEQGVNHVALNLKPSRRPVEEVMQELAEFVLPQFRNQ